VIDPGSGLDRIRNVGIRGDRIAAVTESRITGKREIDARGLVVAPGFIDLHQHGQTAEAYRLMVQDGVTSAFELEIGTGNVERWYADRSSGQLVNYGVGVGHIGTRIAALGDTGEVNLTGHGVREPASAEQIADLVRRIEAGLGQGAVAVGYIPSYTPGATGEELEATFRAAARHNATVHIHVWERRGGLRETIELAQRAGVGLHVLHANSSGQSDPEGFLRLIGEARARGQDVTTEAYPYEAGMSSIQAPSADNWRTWPDTSFTKFEWLETGERLTRESWGRYREKGGAVIIHARTERMTEVAIASPLTMIASDGLFGNGRGHPRTSGTYAKVLGRYVREKRLLSLTDAIRKMTIEPARRLEARVPAMRSKGRILVGADADVTLFDPETVIDRSTYREPATPSAGIPYVLVNGVVVVDRGVLNQEARPGRAITAVPRS
jgi:dihydroorotase